MKLQKKVRRVRKEHNGKGTPLCCPQNLGKMLSLRLHLWNGSYIRALLQKEFLLYNVPPCHWLTLSTSTRKWHLIQIQPLRREIFKELLLIFREKGII